MSEEVHISGFQWDQLIEVFSFQNDRLKEIAKSVAVKTGPSELVVPKAYHEYHMGELRAERDKLAERVNSLEMRLKAYADPNSIRNHSLEELLRWKNQIDAAAANLPEMPWEPTTDATAELAEWGTLLRSAAAALQVRCDAWETKNAMLLGTIQGMTETANEQSRVKVADHNEIQRLISERDALQVRVGEYDAHEQQTHEVLGAILGTDDSLEECAKRMKDQRDAAQAGAEGLRRELRLRDDGWKEARLQGAEEEREKLAVYVEEVLGQIDEPPEASCSCHLSAPCYDCVTHGGLRLAIADLRSALAPEKEEM